MPFVSAPALEVGEAALSASSATYKMSEKCLVSLLVALRGPMHLYTCIQPVIAKHTSTFFLSFFFSSLFQNAGTNGNRYEYGAQNNLF